MTFVTAWLAVAGAAAMSIPIIIHLLARQRRKPIEWAAMRFLIEAFRKHRRRLRIEQLLLLATRCLIVLLLGAALARPLLEQAGLLDHGAGRVVYFVVDTGLIAGLTDDAGRTSLDRNVDEAKRIIGALDATDRIGLVTAARPAQARLVPPSGDHRAVARLLESLSPSDAPTDLAGAMRVLRQALDAQDHEHDQVYVYLLSEFRAGSADLEQAMPALDDLGERVKLLALPPSEIPIENVAIRAVDPVRHVIAPGLADGSDQITVRLERSGGELGPQLTRVRLEGEGIARIEPRTVRWEPGQSAASVSFQVNAEALFRGQREREIVLRATIDDDALRADNTRRAVLNVRPQWRVTLLDRRPFGAETTIDRYRAGQWISRALEPMATGSVDGSVQVVMVDPAAISPADMRATDMVVAPRPDMLAEDGWRILRRFIDEGGLLLITPPGEQNLHQWTERLASDLALPWRVELEVEEAEVEGFFLAAEQPHSELLRLLAGDLDDLARPVVTFRRLRIDREQTSATTLLAFEDEQPLLIVGSPHEAADENDSNRESCGMVVLLTAAPELTWTNLPSKPLMVPLMQEVLRQGMSMIRGMERITAGEQPLVARGAGIHEMIGRDDQRILLDEHGRVAHPLTTAGTFEVRDAAGQRVRTLVVNVDPDSGRADPQASSTVMNWLATSGAWSLVDTDQMLAALRAGTGGAPIAGLLLLIVLGLVVLETLLARRFSHAYRDEEVPPHRRAATIRTLGAMPGAQPTGAGA